MDGQDHETIETTYRQVFGLTAISEQCPPCEIEWEPNTDVFYRCQRLADIGGFYQAFGLQVSTRAGERLDHITAQAEFLYVLLAKEAAAQDAGNQEGVEICRDARRKFFQEHVGWWLPAFAHVLSRVAPIGYYSQLATLIAGVSALERVALGLPPLTRRLARGPAPPKLSQVEAEAGCGNSADCPQGSL
jgi:TorA maturation chaperone TorD